MKQSARNGFCKKHGGTEIAILCSINGCTHKVHSKNMCKFHNMTKVGSDGGMAIGGSITISSGIGTATSGNIGVTSDEPPHEAHNDDMATENGRAPRGAMPNNDVDDGGGEAHAMAWDFLGNEGGREGEEGQGEDGEYAVMEEEDEGNIGHHLLHFGEPVTYSEHETKYGVERDVIAAMMDLSSPAAPTPKYPNGSNCDAASRTIVHRALYSPMNCHHETTCHHCHKRSDQEMGW